MRAAFNRKRREKGAMLILLLTMMPLFLIPLVGLAIDGTMLYIVQAKLSSAVDGAALGAGRLLGTPADPQEIAGEFLNVNFPNQYWGTVNNSLTPQITYTTNIASSTIHIYATVQVPLLFMRIFHQSTTTVAAVSTVTRQQNRVMLVLDRSASMSGAPFTAMQNAAKSFVGMFTANTDEVGLVVFGGPAVVAYPTTRPYNLSVASGGGPDINFATSATTGPMIDSINAMLVGGGNGGYTGTSEGLTLAYIELQKASARDFAANGSDNVLNAIVLFTDGVPTSMALNPNNPNDANGTSIKASSTCTNKSEVVATASTHMRGWAGAVPPMAGTGWTWGTPQGIYLIPSVDPNAAHTVTWWLGAPGNDDHSTSNPTTAVANCAQMNQNGSSDSFSDMGRIPTVDFYGTPLNPSTDGNAYQHSSVQGINNAPAYNVLAPTTGSDFGISAWTAADNIARIIRTQGAMNGEAGNFPSPAANMKPIVVFTIGFTGDGGVDDYLLKRIANDPASDIYVVPPAQQTGQYVSVNNLNQLGEAFTSVASSLLRLAQ